eukprot:COSAG06_NODE_624_length_13686_cov_86.804666_2_plen_41_part_00
MTLTRGSYYDCFMDNHYGISSSDDLAEFTGAGNAFCKRYF